MHHVHHYHYAFPGNIEGWLFLLAFLLFAAYLILGRVESLCRNVDSIIQSHRQAKKRKAAAVKRRA